MAKISLEKVEQDAPELVELFKKTTLSLDKIKMRDHIARVCLVLDISSSMSALYDSGKIDDFVSKVMAIGLQFDDDGQIDCFAFGVNCHYIGEFGISRASDALDYRNCVKTIRAKHPLEPGTQYLKALDALSEKYADSDLPVYCIFLTDGETQDAYAVERKIISMSKEPIFIQFVGLSAHENILPKIDFPADDTGSSVASKKPAKKGFFARLFSSDDATDAPSVKSASPARKSQSQGFNFLMKLDEMDGRVVDAVNFFAIKDPSKVEDELLYQYLMNEYPSWVVEAKKARILR